MDTQPTDGLQLRGWHRHFLGEEVKVYSRNGLVKAETRDGKSGLAATTTMTPDQADELARDLTAYAEYARRTR